MKIMEKYQEDIKSQIFELDLYKNQVNQLSDLTKNQERVISYLNKDPQIYDAKYKSIEDGSMYLNKYPKYSGLYSDQSNAFKESENICHLKNGYIRNPYNKYEEESNTDNQENEFNESHYN